MRLLFGLAVVLVPICVTPAFAEFPPPGVYDCATGDSTAWGVLTLSVAGGYAFDSQTLPSGSGQVASSGNSVNALTGPLAELHVTGSFSLDPTGAPMFEFDADIGTLRCTLPPF